MLVILIYPFKETFCHRIGWPHPQVWGCRKKHDFGITNKSLIPHYTPSSSHSWSFGLLTALGWKRLVTFTLGDSKSFISPQVWLEDNLQTFIGHTTTGRCIRVERPHQKTPSELPNGFHMVPSFFLRDLSHIHRVLDLDQLCPPRDQTKPLWSQCSWFGWSFGICRAPR